MIKMVASSNRASTVFWTCIIFLCCLCLNSEKKGMWGNWRKIKGFVIGWDMNLSTIVWTSTKAPTMLFLHPPCQEPCCLDSLSPSPNATVTYLPHTLLWPTLHTLLWPTHPIMPCTMAHFSSIKRLNSVVPNLFNPTNQLGKMGHPPALVRMCERGCSLLHMGACAKTVLTTWGSILGNRLKVDSGFYPSEVSKMSTQGDDNV